MGGMVKSWKGAKEWEKSQWICHLQAKPLTNTTAEMLSFNLRLQNLGSQFSQLGWNKA